MDARQMLDDRMIAALRQSIADAEAKKQTKRLRFLRQRLAEVETAAAR